MLCEYVSQVITLDYFNKSQDGIQKLLYIIIKHYVEKV